MPRKSLIRSDVHPYHVTARCNNKETFHCSMEDVWKIFSFEIKNIAEEYRVIIHAIVVMPNHFHLLISTPEQNLDSAMQKFIAATTKKINAKSGRSGRVFGARYHWSMIDSIYYYDCALKYVYRNPVKAALSDRAENYRYSSLRYALGQKNVLFVVNPPQGISTNIPENQTPEYLNWVNEPFKSEQNIAIQKALRKSTFFPAKDRYNRKTIELTNFSTFRVA